MALAIDDILEKDQLPETEFFERDRLNCDLGLKALIDIEEEAAKVNELADKEIQMIEAYRKKELERLDKKTDWISRGLENYIRNSGDKTIYLVHGTMKLRQGRDKIEIENEEEFMKIAKQHDLVRTKPSKDEPDLAAILAYVKKHGRIPTGIKFVPATTNFSYKLNTKGGNNGDGKEELQTES